MSNTHVLLVATGDKENAFTPYAQGEVFGLPVDEANKVLSDPTLRAKVRRFNPDKDQDLLDAMEGKHPQEATPEVTVANTPKSKTKTQEAREAADKAAAAKKAADAADAAKKAS